MGIRQFKPVTKGTRFRSVSDFAEITRTTPEKSLVEPLKRSGGRDNHGHIHLTAHGNQNRQRPRMWFQRQKVTIPDSSKSDKAIIKEIIWMMGGISGGEVECAWVKLDHQPNEK